MKSNIISAIHHLRIAKEYFQDLQREMKGGYGQIIGKKYENKIDWIYNDFITIPQFPDAVRQGVRNEWNSDVFTVPAIAEKISLLPPEKREMI
jgi:hypothetical protein